MSVRFKAGRTLITGGAGFVGRWFTQRLIELGEEVVVVDNLVPSGGGMKPSDWKYQASVRTHPHLSFIEADCRDYFQSTKTEFNRVFHLAAVVGGREVIENDPLAVSEDLAIDSAFWRWIRDVEPEEVYHFSSSAAYPVRLQGSVFEPTPLDEEEIDFGDSLGQPDLTYGWAKLTSEYLAEIASGCTSSKIVTFRPFSGYGEDQNLAYPFPSIMERAVKFARGEIPSMYVWGSGRQTRDFIHISDVVNLVLQAHPLLPNGAALNLGTGVATSFLELAAMAMSEMGIEGVVEAHQEKPQGVESRFAGVRKLQSLGLAPMIDLTQGVRRSLVYHGASL